MESVSARNAAQPTDNTSQFATKMEIHGINTVVREAFLYYYNQILKGETGLIYNHQIAPLDPTEVIDSSILFDYENHGSQQLEKTVRIVLNGGLGTSMGLSLPKSLIPARGELSFFDLILKQAQRDRNRLVFMNSFHSQPATHKALNEKNPDRSILTFLQNKFPKILQADLSPADYPQNPDMEWNPPGHGDLFAALACSGTLEKLLRQGVRYAYISNCDNLGAYIDLGILGYFSQHQIPFMMEVAQKTPADVKGGHLAKRADGRLLLRESAQCPQSEMDAFYDIKTFRFFNTNSIWVDLKVLRDHLAAERFFKLPLIRNPKPLNPLDSSSPPVYQVETAMGAAISMFEGAKAVQIPRNRFFPVKKCNELLAVRSDRFELSDRFTLRFNPQALQEHLVIELDPLYYTNLFDFECRFSNGIPSLRNCKRLTIKGDVSFGRGITLNGEVQIANTSGEAVFIENGAVLEGQISR